MNSPVLPPNVADDRRSDMGSRKIIERMERLEDRVLKHLGVQDETIESLEVDVRKQLRHHVTYKWLIAVVLTLAGAAVVFAINVGTRMQDIANRQDERTAQQLIRLEAKIDRLIFDPPRPASADGKKARR
jgi:hypothetical protein